MESIKNELDQFATLKSSINKNLNQFTSSTNNNVVSNTNNQTSQKNTINTPTNFNSTNNNMNRYHMTRPDQNLNNFTSTYNSQTKFSNKSQYIFENINTNDLTAIDSTNLNNSVNISSNNCFNLMNKSKKKIEQEDENVFDNINSDELLEIINQNISIFEDDGIALDNAATIPNIENTPNINTQNVDPNMSNNKPNRRADRELNRSSGSKIKVIKRMPEMFESLAERAGNNLNNENRQFSLNSLTTPAKMACSPKHEIKSDQIVKKLLELKERNLLEGMLDKYHLKISFDTQDDVKVVDQKESNAMMDQNVKKLECPICFESDEKYV